MAWLREFLNMTRAEKRACIAKALEPRNGCQGRSRQQLVFQGLAVCFRAFEPLLVYLFIAPLLAGIGMTLRRYRLGEAAFMRVSGNFYYVLAQLLFLWYLRRRSRKRGENFFEAVGLHFRGIRPKLSLYCAAFGALLNLMLSAVVTLLPGALTAAYTESAGRVFEGTDLILVLLSLAVLTPMVEEILIRGYLLNSLLSFYTDGQAIVLSALIFGLCHVQPLWVLYTFFLGLLMAKLALKEDNILYSMLLHAGFNLPTILNALIQQMGAESIFFGSRFMILLYGLAGAAGALYMLLNIQREEELWRI